MQANKENPSRKPLKVAETVGLIVIPFILVLAFGLWLRSATAQPVAQAQSISTPSASAPYLPDGIPNTSFATSSVNGITLYVGNYRLDGAQLLADVCFDMPDDSDWIIWRSWENDVTDGQGHKAPITSISVIEIRYPPTLVNGKLKQRITDGNHDGEKDARAGQKMGQRCDTVRYNLPSDFDPSQFTITINSIARNPDESDTCGADDTPYMKKIQAELDKRKSGIKIKSAHSDGDGVCGVRIAQKPQKMSQETAQNTINDNEMFIDLFGIRGPWVFAGGIK